MTTKYLYLDLNSKFYVLSSQLIIRTRIFTDPAIVLFIYMLSFIFVLVRSLFVWKRICGCFFYCPLISVYLEIQLSRGAFFGFILNQFSPWTLFHVVNWIAIDVCRWRPCVWWFESRYSCLYCRYWWNCWLSLFKISFHLVKKS
jgi:hypothetical protein